MIVSLLAPPFRWFGRFSRFAGFCSPSIGLLDRRDSVIEVGDPVIQRLKLTKSVAALTSSTTVEEIGASRGFIVPTAAHRTPQKRTHQLFLNAQLFCMVSAASTALSS